LLELESRLDLLDVRMATERCDLDHDGVDERFLRNSELQIALRLDGTAAIRELDSYALMHNFGDTLRRHREHYHARVVQGATTEHRGEGIASAHERFGFRHPISAADFAPDSEPRDIARDSWTVNDGTAHAIDSYVEDERAA